jgi:ADP-ribose pyrophosphatase YjhB (NUDIX family)
MRDLTCTLAELEVFAPNPEQGLPEELLLFISRMAPLVNVDLLIQDASGRTLLTWRDDQFYGPGWHVPGGIIRYKESAANRVREVARSELGAEVDFDPAPIAVVEYISPTSRSRGHFVSLLYRCWLLTPPDESLRFITEAPQTGHWRWHDHCPEDLLTEQNAYRRYLGLHSLEL